MVVVLISVFVYISVIRERTTKKKLSIGVQFHYETSLTWRSAVKKVFRRAFEKKVNPYKVYPNAEVVKLPKAIYQGITVENALAKRRSKRSYSSKPLSLTQLSQLLFAAQGLTSNSRRTAPSAAAKYPIETYLVVNNVEDLAQGIYHYSVQTHALEQIKTGDFSSEIISAGLEQEMLGEANVTFVLSAIFDRVCQKFGERGFRYSYMEAGHISQNISLQAVSLGLGSVCVGAFLDKDVNKLIGLNGFEEAVIYLHAVGTL